MVNKDDFEKLLEKHKGSKSGGKVGVPMDDFGIMDLLRAFTVPKETKSELSYTEREVAYEEYLMKIDLATEMYLEGVLNALTINKMIFNQAVARFKKERELALKKSISKLEKDGNIVKFPEKENENGK